MYSVVDERTGEIVAEKFIFFGRPKKHYDKNYIKVFTCFLDSIVEDDEIAGKAIRLLFYLISKLDYNSLIIKVIPQDAIKDLNVTKDTYYRWFNTLQKKGLIRKIDRYTIELTPYQFIKGDMKTTIKNSIEQHFKS